MNKRLNETVPNVRLNLIEFEKVLNILLKVDDGRLIVPGAAGRPFIVADLRVTDTFNIRSARFPKREGDYWSLISNFCTYFVAAEFVDRMELRISHPGFVELVQQCEHFRDQGFSDHDLVRQEEGLICVHEFGEFTDHADELGQRIDEQKHPRSHELSALSASRRREQASAISKLFKKIKQQARLEIRANGETSIQSVTDRFGYAEHLDSDNPQLFCTQHGISFESLSCSSEDGEYIFEDQRFVRPEQFVCAVLERNGSYASACEGATLSFVTAALMWQVIRDNPKFVSSGQVRDTEYTHMVSNLASIYAYDKNPSAIQEWHGSHASWKADAKEREYIDTFLATVETRDVVRLEQTLDLVIGEYSVREYAPSPNLDFAKRLARECDWRIFLSLIENCHEFVAFSSPVGWPDLTVLGANRSLRLIEVKSKNDRLNANQKSFYIRKMTKLKGIEFSMLRLSPVQR